jgi:dye decolorizing peroxidase
MMTLLTDDASRLTQGEPALPDNDPYLATNPARLTVTFGFGPGFFSKLGLSAQQPVGFAELPSFSIDQLTPEFSGGDLLIQIGSDDPLTLSHAVRQLTRTARSFAEIIWSQNGFTQDPAVALSGKTGRNLFGQVDGTINPRSTEEYAAQVWSSGQPAWFAGGSQMVLRRIEMNLDTWDQLDEGGKELAVGRKLSNGAPLTGAQEFDPPDLSATTEAGLPVIASFAHMRRAMPTNPEEKFLRRPVNYDEGLHADGRSNVGQLFAAYMANIEKQYIPVQQRLADLDLMNTWTTPIGSAVFALPPGCQPGGYIGEGLLES